MRDLFTYFPAYIKYILNALAYYRFLEKCSTFQSKKWFLKKGHIGYIITFLIRNEDYDYISCPHCTLHFSSELYLSKDVTLFHFCFFLKILCRTCYISWYFSPHWPMMEILEKQHWIGMAYEWVVSHVFFCLFVCLIYMIPILLLKCLDGLQ